jgi:hypothetical protein
MSPHAISLGWRAPFRLLLAAFAVSLGGCEGWADPLAAIVENVDAQVKGVGFMDYLEAGRTLDLGAAGWIEIGYFASCTHERITGGIVRIGVERSEALGGRAERRQVECDKENIVADKSQAVQAAGSAERTAAKSKTSIPVSPRGELRLHGAAPIVVAQGGGEVVISRLADKNDRQTIALDGRGAYDFARFGRSLKPGAVYKAALGRREIVFRIDRDAREGRTDMLGRLIVFAPERP